MTNGLVVDIDCERKPWVVLRLLRLGDSKIRYVLNVQEISNGRKLIVSAKRQLEGDSLIGGDVVTLEKDHS